MNGVQPNSGSKRWRRGAFAVVALLAALALGLHADVVSADGSTRSSSGFCLLSSMQLMAGRVVTETIALAKDLQSLYDLHQLQYAQVKVSANGVDHDALLLEIFAPALSAQPATKKCRT